MLKTDLLIVGAGPASLAAADVLAAYDLEVMIVDEQPRPGGQIYRQPPQQFKVRNWLTSRIYARGKRLLQRVVDRDRFSWLTQTTVLGIVASEDEAYPHTASVCGAEGISDIAAKAVLLAPGCHDMSLVFPGWNLPGVMATGGIQAFVKSQQLIPGEEFVFVGSHPLQLIVADQIVQAGGRVREVIFSQSPGVAWALLKSPLVLLRHADKFIYIAMTFLRLLKAGVAIRFRETVVAAHGDELLEGLSVARIDSKGNLDKGRPRRLACDRLGICFSFLASSELARQRGARCLWSAESGGWIIAADPWMCTDIPGLFVAGEISGVAGAEVAMEEGRLAALGIAQTLGKISLAEAQAQSLSLRKRLGHLNEFADLLKALSFPGEKLLQQMMTPESTLCKCEEISVAEFEQQLTENSYIGDASAAKLLSRTGMGLCQGRYCQYHITRLLAQHKSLPAESIGPFTARFPAKPVSIGALIK